MKRKLLMMLVLGLFFSAQGAPAGWTTAKRLTWTSGVSSNPAIAVDPSGNLHVVWDDDTPGYGDIYYKRSTDGGTSWTPSQRLTWNSGTSQTPVIAADPSGHLHVIWSDNTGGIPNLFYRRSTDGGVSWTASQRLTWLSSSSLVPAIAADLSGNLHVVWFCAAAGNWEIYYKKSTDGGTSWTPSQRLTWNSGVSFYPVISVDSLHNPYVAWFDDTSGNFEICFRMSSDGGTTWRSAKRLSQTSGKSEDPAIAVAASGHLHLVWQDDTPGNSEIYYEMGSDGGANWTTAKRITWTSGSSNYPSMAIDSSGNPHIVWMDNTSGDDEIYYRDSLDGGANWEPSQRLTWTSGWSGWPEIAVDSFGNLHVVWRDSMPGNLEIYYKKYVKE
jgi:hypothetical protein